MEDLKQYKEAWQKQDHSESQINSNAISKMIHKKSSSLVKWIFYISIIEIIVLTLVNIFIKTDWNELKDIGLYNFFIGVSILSYVIPIIFIYLFYKNYKSISVTDSTKGLMKNILKTRQTVKYYIFTILALVAFSLLYGFSIAIKTPDYVDIIEGFGENGQLIVWSIVILFTLITLGFFLLVYLVLYGILLKRLNENYKELLA